MAAHLQPVDISVEASHSLVSLSSTRVNRKNVASDSVFSVAAASTASTPTALTPMRKRGATPPRSSLAAAAMKPTYVSRRSPSYILCVLLVTYIFFYNTYWKQTFFCYEHYEQLKQYVHPPWAVYRWLGSKGVDVYDSQWYYFVVALPPTLPILVLFIILSRRCKRKSSPVYLAYAELTTDSAVRLPGRHSSSQFSDSRTSPAPSESSSRDANDSQEFYFGRTLTNVYVVHAVFGFFIISLLTGPGSLFGLALILLNYFGLAHMFPRYSFRTSMTVMWTVHVGVLFLNFHAGGYRFRWFGLSFLDTCYTPLMQWSVHYNMSLLRMIAFNNDYWESLTGAKDRRLKAIHKHERCCVECALIREANSHLSPTGNQAESLRCYKCRTECPRPVSEYNLLSYLAYMFYPPLLIAGPMSSFNAYVSHLHFPTRVMSSRAVWRYGLRFLGNAVFLSTAMHYSWTTAVMFAKVPARALSSAAPSGSVAGHVEETVYFIQQLDNSFVIPFLYLMLAFLWLKFNVFWKFFRFFALLDGVDVPEDMRRCFTNTVSIQGFWRDWHASFNQWIVRYMYIPMGGSSTKFLSIFPIFFFIAIWHDIELRLLYWAGFICLFFVPEIILTSYFSSTKNPTVVRLKRRVWLWRMIKVFAAMFMMFVLITTNLIGFSVGMAGAKTGLFKMFTDVTPLFVCGMFFAFFGSAYIAIQDREQEAFTRQMLIVKFDLQSR